ncbi:PP2C family protein-serine/threonine phosphatase [Amphibiibacter pelophylacis]|uniref:Protein phosphatase 2C domain-containing protein n=1 Tax=Amphibiibacter pelophylacis TaxID=1799477 RepID=A0ACC6NXZ8_9BURK
MNTPPAPDPSGGWLAAPCDFDLLWGAATDVGLVRRNNEDAVRIEHEADLAFLADGMGGYSGGEVASRMAVNCACTQILSALGRATSADSDSSLAAVQQALHDAQWQAHHQVMQQARRDPALHGMGTTLAGLWLRRDRAFVCHVGDSRIYCWRAGELLQITRDHTVLQEQIDAGLPAQSLFGHPAARNVLTRALGIEGAFGPETRVLPVVSGDLFLMCSDGLTDALDDAGIARLCAGLSAPQALAEALVRAANEHGGRDNVTVLTVRVGSLRTPPGLSGR